MRPSVKTLESAFPGKGKELRKLLTDNDAVNKSEAVQQWVKQCYNPPAMSEKRMLALNECLEGYGVECTRGNSEHSPSFEYINMGDTYNTTIVRFEDGRYRVTCWGDIVEKGNYA